MARKQFVRRTSTPNRSWSGSSFGSQTIAGNTAVLLGTFTLSNPGIDETVLRTLGSFNVRSDQNVATEVQQGAIGMIVVSDQAVSVGITAIPHPVTDIADDGWFLFAPISQSLQFSDATGVNYAPRYDFDSKAKRVTHDGQSIAIVVENSTTQGFSLSMVLRMLSMVRGT